jgi:hypothetical protein
MSDVIGNGSRPPVGEDDDDHGLPPWWSWHSLASPGGLAVAGLALGFGALAVLFSAQPIAALVSGPPTNQGDIGNAYFWPAVVGALVAALGLASSLLGVRACHGRDSEFGWVPAIARGGLAVSEVSLAIQLTVIGLVLAASMQSPGAYSNFG